MADTGIKISGLTEATSAADADVVAGVQSSTTKKFPLSVLFNYIKGKLTASDIGAQAKITASGILKGDGIGGVSAAVAGTDYQAPLTAGTDYATPAALSATQQISALPLADPAAVNIAAGKYVVYNNLLYLTNAAISSGETAASFASKIDAVPDGGLNALKAAFDSSFASLFIKFGIDNSRTYTIPCQGFGVVLVSGLLANIGSVLLGVLLYGGVYEIRNLWTGETWTITGAFDASWSNGVLTITANADSLLTATILSNG